MKAVFPVHLHTRKLSCHDLTTTKRSRSGMSFLSLAMRSDGMKATSHAPTGTREREREKTRQASAHLQQTSPGCRTGCNGSDRQRDPACLTTTYDENTITLEAWRLATGCAELQQITLQGTVTLWLAWWEAPVCAQRVSLCVQLSPQM